MPANSTSGLAAGFDADYRWRFGESSVVRTSESRQHVWMRPLDRSICAFSGLWRRDVSDCNSLAIAPLDIDWSD
jgi:hypothetical protein